jgi:hypothetical protein
MTQVTYWLILFCVASAAFIFSLISLWLQHKSQNEQYLPNALSKKLAVIALALEARSKFSDTAMLSNHQLLLISSVDSIDLSEERSRAKTKFEMALEQIDRCDEFCAHARSLNYDEFEKLPGFAITAENFLMEATEIYEAEKVALLDLRIKYLP